LQEITINKLFKEQIIIKQYEKGYRFSVDSPILADFVYEDDRRITYLEIGTGTGIIPIIMSFFDKINDKIDKIYAVELQESLYNLAKENIDLNNILKVELINQDIRKIKTVMEPNTIDVVFSNPPFFEISNGRVNPNNEKFIARHEVSLNLEEILKASNYLLKPNGKLKLIYPVERLSSILITLNKYSYGTSKIINIFPKKGENAKLLLIEAIKGKKSTTKILPPIYINKNDREYSDFVNKILEL
jgi:tRNA1(Val) A37 N6-methylase TrmN6